MAQKALSYTVREKLVVLNFDEIFLSNVANIDRKLVQKVGPHKKCLVVMCRGLNLGSNQFIIIMTLR